MVAEMSVAKDAAGRPDPAGGRERLLARAGRHVEHAAARRDARQVEHPLGEGAEHVGVHRRHPAPRLGDLTRLPGRRLLRPAVIGLAGRQRSSLRLPAAGAAHPNRPVSAMQEVYQGGQAPPDRAGAARIGALLQRSHRHDAEEEPRKGRYGCRSRRRGRRRTADRQV
jgi:hypothetical protein